MRSNTLRASYSFSPVRIYPRATAPICQQCFRSFATTAVSRAGHNKWSKTKHIKAVTDKKKMSDRTSFGRTIAMYSRMYGDDVKNNPQLAKAISEATRASVPKTLIENAVAKGQGRSASGAKLEPMIVEVLLPGPNIALIIDIETDNKNRTLQDVRHGLVKKSGGVVGTAAHYFTKQGKAILKAKEDGPTLSDILEEAIEHEGVEDVEELPGGDFLAWTQPAMLMAITNAFTAKFGLEVLECDIVWAPNEETMSEVNTSGSVNELDVFLSGIREFTEVKGVFANIRRGSSINDDEWDRIESNLDG